MEGTNKISGAAAGPLSKPIAVIKPTPRLMPCHDRNDGANTAPTGQPSSINPVSNTNHRNRFPETLLLRREAVNWRRRRSDDFYLNAYGSLMNAGVAGMSVALKYLLHGCGWGWVYARRHGTTKFHGCKISVISVSNIRYEGIVLNIQLDPFYLLLSNVRVFGTDDRISNRPIPPSTRTRHRLGFDFRRIEDVNVLELKPRQSLEVPTPQLERGSNVTTRIHVRETRSSKLRREHNAKKKQ